MPAYPKQIIKAVQRNDFVSINHRITEFLASYFDLLFAINEVTHPGEKRLVQLCKTQCKILPENFEENLNLSSAEKIFLKSRMGINLMGAKETMAKTWKEIKEKFNPDEIIAVSYMPKLEELEKSYRILKEVVENN